MGVAWGSKVRPWQLMRQSTSLALCGRYGERKRLRRCEVGVTVVGWCCHTHTGNEVSSCVGRVAAKSVCILAQCGFSGIVCGLPVDFRWPVNTSLSVGVLEAQDGDAVGVAWSFPSGLASGPLSAFIVGILRLI